MTRPETTRECRQISEALDKEITLTIGHDRIAAHAKELRAKQHEETLAAQARAATPRAPPVAEDDVPKFVWPALGTRLPTHLRRDLDKPKRDKTVH
mmetsp:Transcript_13803/g.49524  ORF Transcript_13803/g.49524 Transcript_13803/m.49524 type:complete len:96 (+) Transcript_13803:189-476(+)